MAYIPHKTEAYLARMKPLNDGLEELCLLQLSRPLSQQEIADYCGVSQNLVHRVEKRARKKLLAGLAKLGITKTSRNAFARDGWERSTLTRREREKCPIIRVS